VKKLIILPILAVLVICGIVTVVEYHPHINRSQTASPLKPHRRPILIPGVQEPEEMRVEPFPIHILSAPEQMLWLKGNDSGKRDGSLAVLNRVLAKYPNYSDGYVMRLGLLCDSHDHAAILSDINSALKYISSSQAGKDSLGSLLSMRAKVKHDNGDDAGAMEDLDEAIHANLTNATNFVNSGSMNPGKSASSCTWTEPDMDALLQRFPTDYRAYLFRGLYYSRFTISIQDSLKPALENFRKSSEMNPGSALPHFFSADMLRLVSSLSAIWAEYLKKLSDVPQFRQNVYDKSHEEQVRRQQIPSVGDLCKLVKRYRGSLNDMSSFHDDLNRVCLKELNAALTLDPSLPPALCDRAEVYFELKQFQQAIPDYNKILTLNPTDAGAYNDRALAKMQLGQSYDAISDFDKAIENKERELQKSSSYENRADAYMKTQQWDHAIRDLTTAISLETGGVVLAMNIKQFRALYPEYTIATDEAVAHKLNQTFFPSLKYEDFSKDFLKEGIYKDFFPSTIIPEIYLKRSNAYLKAGNWRRAAIDFRRAVNGFPNYATAIDRWREADAQKNGHIYVDMQTIDYTHADAIKLWIKRAHDSNKASSPYFLQQYELNCSARTIHTVSVVNYDSLGNVIGSRESDKWESVVPDTLGETLLNGICKQD